VLVTVPGFGDGKLSTATQAPIHFQSSSAGIGERFVAGPS
jgi:hypothetical protein